MHSDHDLMDNRDDCDECAPMRVPHFYTLGNQRIRLPGILHLRLSFCNRLCNIELLA